jgi:hypothetical protein
MQFQVSQVGVFQPCQWEATPLPTEAIEQWADLLIQGQTMVQFVKLLL